MEKQPKYGLFLYLWASILFLKLATVALLIHYKPGYSFELKTIIESSLTFIIGLLILIRAYFHDKFLRLTENKDALKFFQFVNQNSPKRIAILCIYLVTKPYLKPIQGYRIKVLRQIIHILTLGIFILIAGILIIVF